MIERSGKHLRLINQSKTAGVKHLCTFTITKANTIPEIKKILYSKIIQQLARQQKYIIKQKEEALLLDKPNARITVKQIKKIHALQRAGNTLETPKDKNVSLSDKLLSETLKISKKQVSNCKEYWKENRLMKIEREKPKFLMMITKKQFYQTEDILRSQYRGIFFYNNCLFKTGRTFYKV
jgi:L-lactate utilization protein LutC